MCSIISSEASASARTAAYSASWPGGMRSDEGGSSVVMVSAPEQPAPIPAETTAQTMSNRVNERMVNASL